MWRRTYLLLALVRLYFALCPSYLHPDEHFQGPEVIAGELSNNLLILLKLKIHRLIHRTNLLLPSSQDMGIYFGEPY